MVLIPGYKKRFNLTLAEFKFVGYHIHHEGNNTQAAWSACPSIPNRSVAATRGMQMSRRPSVIAAIDYYRLQFMADIREKCRHKIVKVLSARAFYDTTHIINRDGSFNLPEVYDEDGFPRLVTLADFPLELRQCIEGIERKRSGPYSYVTVKLANRNAAIDRLNDFMQLFKKADADKTAVTDDTAKSLSEVFNSKPDTSKKLIGFDTLVAKKKKAASDWAELMGEDE